jgi:hypothetical protein
MTSHPNIQAGNRKVRLKSIILPNEHGSWGFLLEPLVAANAVAPSIGGIWITVMVTGAFLSRQPLKVFLTDWRGKRNLPQTALALNFIFIFGIISIVGLFGSLLFVDLNSFLPFLIITPLAFYQIYCDANKQTRHLWPELTGAVAISSSAAVIALAGGWHLLNALGLWSIFIARMVPSIFYVRNRLRLEKGKDYSPVPVIGSHFMAVIAVGLLVENNLIPQLTIPVFIWFLGRAGWGLSRFREKVKAIRIGIWEVIYGLLMVIAVILGFYLKF